MKSNEGFVPLVWPVISGREPSCWFGAAEFGEDIMGAYVGLVTAQARTQVDYHPVFYQFKSAIGDPGLWEKGLE